ncbi:MAG: glycosyltransferase family 2 protein [bacterium]
MGNKPLLSICIPTYNRQEYLKQCLDSIVNQKGFDTEKIEIVISDNASPDKTNLLVKEYQKKYKNITYSRNDQNI